MEVIRGFTVKLLDMKCSYWSERPATRTYERVNGWSQPVFTCSKPTLETSGQYVKSVQSYDKNTGMTMSLLSTLNIFDILFWCSTDDFKQLNASWQSTSTWIVVHMLFRSVVYFTNSNIYLSMFYRMTRCFVIPS